MAPTVAKAQQRRNRAASVGVVHSKLERDLQALDGNGLVPGLLITGPATIEGKIFAIDNLTTKNVESNLVPRLADAPRLCRPLIGDLAKLHEALKKDLAELEMVLQNPPPAGPTLRPDPPTPVGVVVESEFTA